MKFPRSPNWLGIKKISYILYNKLRDFKLDFVANDSNWNIGVKHFFEWVQYFEKLIILIIQILLDNNSTFLVKPTTESVSIQFDKNRIPQQLIN